MREPLTEVFTFAMTCHEKSLLQRLAFVHGATMSGLLRKLIRDTATEKLPSTPCEFEPTDKRGEERE
jgi:hypothetical protein